MGRVGNMAPGGAERRRNLTMRTRRLKPFDLVPVYHDPGTQLDFEGMALIIEPTPLPDVWRVEFLEEPGKYYPRTVYPRR